MKRAFLILAVSGCLLALSACSTDTFKPPTTDAPIKTDRQTYVHSDNAVIEITATYVNRQDKPVYVPVCSEDLPFHHWEKYEAGRWVVADLKTGYACTEALITHAIAPGGRLSKRFALLLDLAGDKAGFYRLSRNITDVPGQAEEEPVSNAFEVVLP